MATKKRKRTKYDRAGDALTHLHETASRLRRDKDYGNSDRVDIATDSMTGVLNQSGMTCGCQIDYTTHGHKYNCQCRPTKLGEVSGVFFFDGKECRDGSGAFVPTEWCKGPVGRDPRSGRYISIK